MKISLYEIQKSYDYPFCFRVFMEVNGWENNNKQKRNFVKEMKISIDRLALEDGEFTICLLGGYKGTVKKTNGSVSIKVFDEKGNLKGEGVNKDVSWPAKMDEDGSLNDSYD